MKIRPLGDKVLIQRKEGDSMKGLIHVPENAKEIPCEGEILAAGPKCVGIKDGMVVLFHKYAGTEVKLDDGIALMMNEEDVIAVIEEK